MHWSVGFSNCVYAALAASPRAVNGFSDNMTTKFLSDERSPCQTPSRLPVLAMGPSCVFCVVLFHDTIVAPSDVSRDDSSP